MDQQDRMDRAVESLHEAMLGDSRWCDTSVLVDEACGWKGAHLIIVDPQSRGRPEWLFDQFYYHGVSAAELGRDYVANFYERDERIPRLMKTPFQRLVRVTDLLKEPELTTSDTYNDLLRRAEGRKGFNVRMAGPDGLQILMGLADPVDPHGWDSDHVETIERMLPHIRQFVRVRHALVRAEALGRSFGELLDNTMVGVVFLDRRGRIINANTRAHEILRRRDGVSDRDGVLRASVATDDARLGRLLADALPRDGRQAVSGSITLERSLLLPRLVVHVNPVVVQPLELGVRSAAAIVLLVDPGVRPKIDVDLVAATFRLTRAESQVAAALAEGSSVREIAESTFRAESSVRWLVKQIHAKLGISRQADLVRMILSMH